MSVGPDWEYTWMLLKILTGVAAIQALLNACLVFGQYERDITDYSDISTINKSLSSRLSRLAKDTTSDPKVFEHNFLTLKGEVESQENYDEKKQFTVKERRVAARHGMFRYQLPCTTCKEVPKSVDAQADGSKCNLCGDF